MCGIVGGFSDEPLSQVGDRGRIDAAVDLLAHRGPDDRGVYIADDGRAFLGHRRLSIIDVVGGRQPLTNENGRVRLVYNGEIYNYRALQKELIARGHRLATGSDGETAVHLYEEAPARFVERLEGMFALAILDEEAGELTLARDRNGIKPLYYFFDGRSLLFASELKAIVALLPTRPALCGAALRQYLRWKYVPAPLTIYENVFKLRSGHVLRVRRAGGRLESEERTYWRPEFGGDKIVDEREAVAMLDERLRAAVASHLESDVEVGALLSGGVDSSLVVALASILSGRRIKTFSVGFEEAGFDQLPFARKLAERYETEHFEERVAAGDPKAHGELVVGVEQLVRQFDEPFADSSALACYRVCQAAARHVKVVLTGDGGDETFAGYGRYEEVLRGEPGARGQGLGAWGRHRRLDAASLGARRRFSEDPRQAHFAGRHGQACRRWCCRAVVATSGALFSPEAKFLKRFRNASFTPLEQHEAHQVLCGPWLLGRILGEGFRGAADELDVFDEHRRYAVARGWSALDAAQYVDLRMYLPDDILTKVDRTSMACSLECRVPLLDHRVTEFSGRVGAELKIRDGVRKYLLKRVAERYVPHELLYRAKRGFRVPIRRWFKGALLDQTARLVEHGALVERGILDARGWRWMVRAQRRPWIDFGSALWAILFLEHWARGQA